MFSSGKRGRHSAANKSAMPSIIGADLKIVGDLACEGEVQIEGVVDGDVTCQSILVGADAKVAGSLQCESARICGDIKGTITARVVELASSAHVVGDIVHERITIETGAYFEGSLRHIDATDQAVTASSSAPTPISEPPAKAAVG